MTGRVPPEVVERFLTESRDRIERQLDALLPEASAPPARLHEAMRYAVLPGGKRLRPAIAFGAAQACGRPSEEAMPVAVAVELVHAYSLVHDDLPAMDDDEERRGRPTVHVRFGQATAILVGDALLAEAFRALGAARVPARVVEALGAAAGSRALVGGQQEDLAFRGADSTEKDVARIHAAKTGALFAFAAEAGGALAGASDDLQARLGTFGLEYGRAFQLADDLDDQGERSCSALAVLSCAEVAERARTHAAAAVRALEAFPGAADPLRGLAEQLALRLR